MNTLRAYLAVATVAAFCCPALGQIAIGDNHEPYNPIVAKLTTPIPDGANVNGGWGSDAAWLPCQDGTIHIWAKPGSHKVWFRGFWVQTNTVTVDGQELKVLVDAGWVDEQAEFAVGDSDGPDPPQPLPPGKRWGLIIRESSEQNPQWAELFVALRFKLGPDELKIEDLDNLTASAWQPYVRAFSESNHRLPVLVVVAEDNAPLKVIPCPSDAGKILQELGK